MVRREQTFLCENNMLLLEEKSLLEDSNLLEDLSF